MSGSIDIAGFDAVVSDIYDAALSPQHWEVALTGLVNRFGHNRWDVAMLLWERVTPPAGRFVGNSGVNAMARHGYVHAFAGNNAWSVRGHDMPVGSVFHSDQLIDRAEFRKTPFFSEFLSSFDLEVGLIALLDRHGGDHLCLCTPGPDNGRPVRLETAVRLLVPHLQRAVRISRRLGEAELSARSSRAVLDVAPSAILLCDETLQLTYANSLGEQMLRGGYLAISRGRLRFADRRQSQRLLTLAAPDAGQRCAAFVLEAPGRPCLAAMALRVEDEASQPLNPDFGQARLLIVAGVHHRASFAHIDHLRAWFDLTPAEARLAATLAEGGSLEDFAAMRGVSINAARFLLRGIYAKTDANRMPQLVAKLQATPLHWHVGKATPELPSPVA